MRTQIFSLASFLAFGAVQAATASNQSLRVDLSWRASLDAQGHVTQLQATRKERADRVPAIRQRLEQEIRTWRFQPGTVNAQPEPTETGLYVRADVSAGSDGTMKIRIVHADVGGSLQKMTPPHYPGEAIRHHVAGEVVLQIAYDSNGRTTEALPATTSPSSSKLLLDASEKASRTWKFSPEIVGGHAIAGTVVVPFCYTLHPMGSDRVEGKCDWKAPGRNDTLNSGETLALNPAAKLLTDVAGRTL